MADTSMHSLIKHRVLLVDDHPLVRRGLRELINEEADLEVVGEAANVPDALREAQATHPHVVVIDITLGAEDGLELIDYIKARWPTMKMLVSSAHDEQTFAGRVLRAGALGFVSKREPLPQVIAALRQVLRGEVYLNHQMATCLLQRAVVGKSLDQDPVQALSNRELQVFEMIGEGQNTREMARKLGISPKTIESHRKVVKTKLGVQNSAQLNRRAFQWVQEERKGTYRSTSSRNAAKETGLTTWSSQPAARYFSRSPVMAYAVRATIGSRQPCTRSRRAAS